MNTDVEIDTEAELFRVSAYCQGNWLVGTNIKTSHILFYAIGVGVSCSFLLLPDTIGISFFTMSLLVCSITCATFVS